MLREKNDPITVKDKLISFLGPTRLVGDDTQPTIAAHYGTTYNAKDRFDIYLGHIAYPYKIRTLDLRLFIGLIQMTAVNTYTTYQTYLKIQNIDGPEGIKPFVQNLVKQSFH